MYKTFFEILYEKQDRIAKSVYHRYLSWGWKYSSRIVKLNSIAWKVYVETKLLPTLVNYHKGRLIYRKITDQNYFLNLYNSEKRISRITVDKKLNVIIER